MGLIDAYVRELGGALRGPRRVRADLVAEARDSLTDAAEAHRSSGAARADAEHRAVTEFGPLPEIASDYQGVLAYAQGRRTALLVFLVCAVQKVGSTYAWHFADMGWNGTPGPGYQLLAHVVDWLGVGVNLVALLALVACGVGTRYLGARRWVPRAVGVFALGVGAFSLTASVLLTTVAPVGSLVGGYHLCWVLIGGCVPLAFFVLSARRCLTAAWLSRHPRSAVVR